MNKNLLSDFDNQILMKFESSHFEDHDLEIWNDKELEKRRENIEQQLKQLQNPELQKLLEQLKDLLEKNAPKEQLENKMKSLGKNISLQGELIGEGIQGNPYKIKGQTVHFFNGFDIDKQTKLGINEFLILLDEMGLTSVPILDVAMLLPDTVTGMLELAEGKSRLNDKTEREGVVVRSLDNTISFKAISNKFLLSEK